MSWHRITLTGTPADSLAEQDDLLRRMDDALIGVDGGGKIEIRTTYDARTQIVWNLTDEALTVYQHVAGPEARSVEVSVPVATGARLLYR